MTLTGLLFAAHPIHTESVASIVGRAEVLYGMFALMAFLSYASAFKHPQDHINASYFPIIMSLVWTAIAVFCKEQGITVIAINAVYDFSVICGLDVPTFLGMLLSSMKRPRPVISEASVDSQDATIGSEEVVGVNDIESTTESHVSTSNDTQERTASEVTNRTFDDQEGSEVPTTSDVVEPPLETVKENIVLGPRLPLYVQAMLKRFVVLFVGLTVIMFFRLRMNGSEHNPDEKTNRSF